MSEDADWDFANREDAKAQFQAAIEYLLKNTSGVARADLVLELIQIVRNTANGGSPSDSLDEGMPGG